jgi:tRNA dimethylallyltransferase
MKKTCIIIEGPTAVGKTALAVQLAKHLGTEIISADSRQCFRELNIGVAKPSAQELDSVPHHFINSHSIHDQVNAKVFEEYALQETDDIFKEHEVVVMVGGTGLYIKAFCEGLDEMPSIDPSVRAGIIADYENKGLKWLQHEVREKDPQYFASGETQNPHRLIRALEVKTGTGKSITTFQQRVKRERPFRLIKVGLELPREQLKDNINKRVDAMMEAGLLEEVKSLTDYQHLPALQTVGYSELFSYFRKELSLDDAVGAIKTNTRQYAKRQLTWFRREQDTRWMSPYDASTIDNILQLLP